MLVRHGHDQYHLFSTIKDNLRKSGQDKDIMPSKSRFGRQDSEKLIHMSFQQYLSAKEFEDERISFQEYLEIQFTNTYPEILRDILFFMWRHFTELRVKSDSRISQRNNSFSNKSANKIPEYGMKGLKRMSTLVIKDPESPQANASFHKPRDLYDDHDTYFKQRVLRSQCSGSPLMTMTPLQKLQHD